MVMCKRNQPPTSVFMWSHVSPFFDNQSFHIILQCFVIFVYWFLDLQQITCWKQVQNDIFMYRYIFLKQNRAYLHKLEHKVLSRKAPLKRVIWGIKSRWHCKDVLLLDHSTNCHSSSANSPPTIKCTFWNHLLKNVCLSTNTIETLKTSNQHRITFFLVHTWFWLFVHFSLDPIQT